MKRVIPASIAAALSVMSFDARAQVVTGIPVVEAMSDYIVPEGLYRVEGARRIHLRCLGRGAPTVVFMAGLGSWSGTWAMVQSEIAKTTRACAWDRAGFGLSDADDKAPQTVGRTTDDLERVLRSAGVEGPYVLVGLSAGAHEVLTFMDRHPRDVAGIVLVDPVRPHDMARETVAGPKAAAADRAYYAGEAHRLRDCAAGVEAGSVKTGEPVPPCFIYYPETPAQVQTAFARLDADPARLRTQASAYEEYEPNGERVVKNDRSYGDLPLIVLSAEDPGPWADEAKDEHPWLLADWYDSHRALKALSRRGERRLVAGSNHLIQLTKPQAVIDAVRDVVRASTKRAAN